MKRKILSILLVFILIASMCFLTACGKKEEQDEKEDKKSTSANNDKKEETSSFEYGFLKLENEEENKIYSPLSIKYALKMLQEGAEGEAKEQIEAVLDNADVTKYESSKNLSLANGLFVNNNQKDTVKQDYIDTLKEKYNAEVIFDEFSSVDNINQWIADKTLNLIKNMLSAIDPGTEFMLVNALAIDMDWANQFLHPIDLNPVSEHEKFSWSAAEQLEKLKFEDKYVSGMRIDASINKYNIVKELGEDSIRETVYEEYKKYVKENTYEVDDDLSEANIKKHFDLMFDGGETYGTYTSKGYLKELQENYGQVNMSTDFMFLVDDDVKAFAKDLKEYNGTTLQYIAIMPTSKKLSEFVEDIDTEKVNTIIGNLKDLSMDSVEEGYITHIKGFIPKFKFDYELKLEEDLKKLGVTNIFKKGNANLKGISNNEDTYIGKAIHKATIELTQDGIKAAAATMMGGYGAGMTFDYIYDVPVKEIDLTFDNPYMFIIRDKKTGEVWFIGTVYDPLPVEEDPENSADPMYASSISEYRYAND